MKRALVLLFFIIAIIGSVYAWMIFRPSPEDLVKSSVRSLIHSSIETMQWNVQWDTIDQKTGRSQFGGWVSYSGMMDMRDLSAIRANGMLGYSSTINQSDFETANVFVTKDAFVFKEERFKRDRSAWVRGLVATSTTPDTWFSIDRNTLLEIMGAQGMIAKGNETALRDMLRQVDIASWFTIVSSTEQLYAGREYMQVHLRLNESACASGLRSLLSAWKNANPTSEDILWADRIAKNAISGDWYVMIDERAGDPMSLTGNWKTFDEDGDISGSFTLTVVFGVGASAQSSMTNAPEDVVDITRALLPQKSGALPSSGDRPTVPIVPSLETSAHSTSSEE